QRRRQGSQIQERVYTPLDESLVLVLHRRKQSTIWLNRHPARYRPSSQLLPWHRCCQGSFREPAPAGAIYRILLRALTPHSIRSTSPSAPAQLVHGGRLENLL